ncbi:MAG: MFS transporter [Bacillota bacterium]
MDQNRTKSYSIPETTQAPKSDPRTARADDGCAGCAEQIDTHPGDGPPAANGESVAGRWKTSFFTVAAGQTFSLIGSAAVQFTLIWWLTCETNSALVLSLAGLLAFVPQMLLGPFAGVWIDRMKRKNVIIASDLFMGAVAGVLALLFLLGEPSYWVVCAAIGVRALGGVFHTPALQAALPMLVPPEQLVRANGLNQFLHSGALLLGPVLGAAKYASLSLPALLLTDLAFAIIASAAVALAKIPDPERTSPKRRAPFFSEMKEGAHVLLKDRRIVVVTLAGTAGMIFFLPLSSLYPLITAALNGEALHAGVIEMSYALGMALFSISMSAVGRFRSKFRAIHIALFLLGATSFVCGILPARLTYFWAFALMCALMGGGSSLFYIPFNAYLQKNVPPEAQGRAFSLVNSLTALAMPVGLLIAGPGAQARGVLFWFAVCGAVKMGISVLSALAVRALGRKTPNAGNE